MGAYHGGQYEQRQTPPPPSHTPPPPSQQWPPRTSQIKPGKRVNISIVWFVVLMLGVAVLSYSCGYFGRGAAQNTTPRALPALTGSQFPPSEQPAPAPAPPPAPAPVAQGPDSTTVGNGDWVAGTHMQPGTYRTNGPAEGLFMFCTGTIKSAGGDTLDLNSSGGEDGGPIQLQVKAGQVLSSAGCQDWTKQP